MTRERRCPECNGELTYCGPMTIDGPPLDCPYCKLEADRDRTIDEIRAIVWNNDISDKQAVWELRKLLTPTAKGGRK